MDQDIFYIERSKSLSVKIDKENFVRISFPANLIIDLHDEIVSRSNINEEEDWESEMPDMYALKDAIWDGLINFDPGKRQLLLRHLLVDMGQEGKKIISKRNFDAHHAGALTDLYERPGRDLWGLVSNIDDYEPDLTKYIQKKYNSNINRNNSRNKPSKMVTPQRPMEYP